MQIEHWDILCFQNEVLHLSSCKKVLHLSQPYISSDVGKDLADPRVLTDVGDVPIQAMRDSGIGDELLMKAISDSVKLVMDEVRNAKKQKH